MDGFWWENSLELMMWGYPIFGNTHIHLVDFYGFSCRYLNRYTVPPMDLSWVLGAEAHDLCVFFVRPKSNINWPWIIQTFVDC